MELDLTWLTLSKLPPARYDENGEETDDPSGVEAPEPPFLSDVSRIIKLAGVKVGYIEAYVLRRDEMVQQFHRGLDSTTQEILDFGRLLFDHRGRLRPQFGTTGSRAGKGVWGHEISTGNLAFISEVNIQSQYRSQGLGKAAVGIFMTELIQPVQDEKWASVPVRAAFLMPGILLDEPENMDDEKKYDSDDSDYSSIDERSDGARPLPPTVVANRERNLLRVNSFFLDCGFRRVGTTPYLGFSLDPDHPSHRLAKASDQPLLRRPAGETSNPQKHFPIHHHICEATSSTVGPDLLPLLSYIRNAPLEQVQRADNLGWTPLHHAAALFNLPVCKALVSRSRKELSATTWDGLTPMELLKAVIQQAEDYRRAMGDEEEIEDEKEDAVWSWFLQQERSVSV